VVWSGVGAWAGFPLGSMDRPTSQPAWGRKPAKALDLSASYRTLRQAAAVQAARLNPLPSFRSRGAEEDDGNDTVRLAAVPYTKLKRILMEEESVSTDELFACVQKHDLIRLARRKGVQLGPRLEALDFQEQQLQHQHLSSSSITTQLFVEGM
jgi:hypothetical protein